MQCYTEDPCVHCVVLQRLVHGELRVMRGQLGLLGGSVVKNPSPNAGDAGLIPGSGISPGEGNGNPLQYSCLENPMDREAWWTTVHWVAKESDMT